MSYRPDQLWFSLFCFQLQEKEPFSPHLPHTDQVQLQTRATHVSTPDLCKTQCSQHDPITWSFTKLFQRPALWFSTTPIQACHDGQIGTCGTPIHKPPLTSALRKHPSASSVSSTSRRTYAPSLHVYVRPPTPQLSLSTDLSEHQSILSAGPESREPHSVHEKRRIKLRLLLCAALLTYQDFYASISNILDCIDTPGSNETRPQLTKLALIISAMAHEIRILAQFVLDGNIPRLSGFWPRAWIILLKLDILSESIRDVIDQLTTDGRRHHQHQKRLRFFHPNDLLVGCQLFFFEREVKVAMKSSFSTLSGLRSLNVFAMDQRQRPFPPATCSQPTRVYDWIRGLGAQDSGYL